jgi:hypothetical protein
MLIARILGVLVIIALAIFGIKLFFLMTVTGGLLLAVSSGLLMIAAIIGVAVLSWGVKAQDFR